jgi:hypothetical protein
MATVTKVRDNIMKRILSNPDLCADFLHDFCMRDKGLSQVLRDVTPADIEDVEERYLPLNREGEDSDAVVKVNLKGFDTPLFVIALIEHQSGVNHRMAFRMLTYVSLILENYEKEINKVKNVTELAAFKYPPVLPIVFYDGPGNWTAETNFHDKTEHADLFNRFIPDFEYMVVNLNDYSMDDITRCMDVLSIVMLIDRAKKPADWDYFGRLPQYYNDYIAGLKLPEGLKKLVLDSIHLLKTKVDVPEEFVDNVNDHLETEEVKSMFDEFANAWNTEMRKAKTEMRAGLRAEVKAEVKAEERQETSINIARRALAEGATVQFVQNITGLDAATVQQLR